MKYTKFTTFVGMCLGVMSINAFAVEPQIKESELVIPEPSNQHVTSTKRVTARLTQSHYHKFQLDDAFSEKIFNRYIDWLDGSHNTFLQSDIDELRAKYATKLDEELYEAN